MRARTLSGGWKRSAPGMRRVVVKTRYVQGVGKNGKSAAHLRYIQRDGTSRDGERGQLYSANEDRADGTAFVERGADDRHQFRFIVSPEDGADLSDLTAYTRDLMARSKPISAPGSIGSLSITTTQAIPMSMSSCAARTSWAKTSSSTATISPTASANAPAN